MSSARPKPTDLEHHFSQTSKKRAPNVLKEYYKYLRIPEMGNLAGGLPSPSYFPFNNVDLSLSNPDSLGPSKYSEAAGGQTPQLRIPRRGDELGSVRNVDLTTALQYGSASGFPPLYAWLRKLTTTIYHPNIPYDGGADIIVNGGSADGLFKVFELLFNPWDKTSGDARNREGLIVEEFVYGPPIAQLKPKDVNIVPVKMDTEGMLAYGTGSLCHVLETWDCELGKRPHVVYLVPTGQNPRSGVLSLPRRREIYDICSRFDLVIVEDDPYWNLYYPSTSTTPNFPKDPNHNYCVHDLRGKSTGYAFLDELVPSFLSLDNDGRVIRLDSFSKTVAPGCRLGWVTAQPSVCEKLFRITDGTTQQPSGFVQAIVTQLIGDFGRDGPAETAISVQKPGGWGVGGWINWLEGLRFTYQRRMEKMAAILEENRFLGIGGVQTEMFSFQRPAGGMFIWVKVNIGSHPLTSINPRRLMQGLWVYCTQHPYRILVVPGGDFAANQTIKRDLGYVFFRFCFAAVEESILEAKSRAFAEACESYWAITDAKVINEILHEEDLTKQMYEAGYDDTSFDREVVHRW
ncbi:aromatic amino acid aminotransferase [Colletotrichum lupini]|uniref:Aromatic amino acid aminotransferase n=1 Tax=Colletotrichum lupini TaxID=145971 RepID=A0A9Q8SG83_9PEZI|nr:aromatic amino acid aminotransferase [Colletotrichum lupini]UQC76709.1 aromatic amino acid aminotransferase [Colletotrichum lupini]